MENLEEEKSFGTAKSVGSGANKKKKRKTNRKLFKEAENDNLDISDVVLESHPVDELNQQDSVTAESNGVEKDDVPKKKKNKKRKRKESIDIDKSDVVLEAHPVNGQKDLDELNQKDSVKSESNEVENVDVPKKNKKRKVKNDNTDESDVVSESCLMNGQKQSVEINQNDSVISENNEVENADVSKKKKKNKKKTVNTDTSDVVLKAHPVVGGQNQSDELSQQKAVILSKSNEVENTGVRKKKKKKKRKKKNVNTDKPDELESVPVNGLKEPDEPKSMIPESSVGENAGIISKKKKKKKKKRKKRKNVIPEESNVLESHPVNGQEESGKSVELKSLCESIGGENAGVPKKKKNRKRKKGKFFYESGFVSGDDEKEEGSPSVSKRIKVDDIASETSGQSSAVLVVPGVVENSESVANRKKRKKKNKRKKVTDVDLGEIKEVSDEPEVKRLKVDTESNDLVNSGNVSATQVLTVGGDNEPLSLSSETVIAAKKKRKKKKKKKKAAAVVSEIQEIKDVVEEQEKIEDANEEPKKTEITNEEQEEAEIVGEEQEGAEIVSEEQEKSEIVGEEQEKSEIVGEEQEKSEIVGEEQEKSDIVGEEQEKSEIVGEEQEKSEIASEKQESELKEKIEDVSEEQEELDITSEKDKEITIVSESEKHEENESSDKQGEVEILSKKQDSEVTSKIEENDVKMKKKEVSDSEVNQDVTGEETVLPLDVVNEEPESVSEKQETVDADNEEENKSDKKKKKKKKKSKESLEDIQSASKGEENKAEEKLAEKEAEGDSQPVNEVEEIAADSKKKKKRKKKKKKGSPEEADQSANGSTGWTVSDIKEPSIKEAKKKDGINKSSKTIEASQLKKEAVIPTPANLNEMYIRPPMKDEITRCWTEGSPLQRDNGFELLSQPFKCCYMPDFIQDTSFLQNVKEELSGIDLHVKNNDLYKFHQTPDLKSVSSSHIARLREFLYGDFRKWLSGITGIELNDTVAMGFSRYGYTDTLLCHDDELEGRRVAYIFYLTPPWYEKDGGMLDLYDVDNKGQPRDIVKSLKPRWNTFAFFEVSPVSFHQVREVLSKDKVRLSINGWFHGPNIERPPKHIEAPRPLEKPGHFEEDELYTWINPSYLDTNTQREIRKKFQNDSEIELESFICEEKYQELSSALQSSQLKWHCTGPANKQSCKVLKQKKLPDVITECSKFLKSEALFLILSQLTGLKLHLLAPPDSDPDSDEDESKDSNPGMTLDIRQWSHGCYTLLRDSDQGDKASALDATLFINVADKWSLEHGGFTSYIAKDEDEELLTVVPRSNCFALVYKDAETLKFTKYVNSSVKELGKQGSVFYDFNCTYKE